MTCCQILGKMKMVRCGQDALLVRLSRAEVIHTMHSVPDGAYRLDFGSNGLHRTCEREATPVSFFPHLL